MITAARPLAHAALAATLTAALTVAAAAPAVAAQTASASAPEPSKPVTDREPTAVDVVTTPASDLNLKKNEIPPILALAEQDPYGLPGGPRCPAITAEIEKLDAALGDDIDVAQAKVGKLSAGRVAQSVVGSFIPFRGVIRQLSGASEQERRLQSAINAGTARRGFLKGVGLQRGCAWPARPATPQVLARIAKENAARARAEEQAKQRK